MERGLLNLFSVMAKVQIWNRPQLGAVDAEIKVPSDENTEL